MFLISHFAVPVLAVVGTEEVLSRKTKDQTRTSTKNLLLIGIVGLVPDAFYPHLGGGSHYQSVSHSIWAFMFFIVAITVFYFLLSKPGNPKLLLYLLLSLLSHYVIDFFSSGIKWLYPLSDSFIGIRLIPLGAWILSDFFLLGLLIVTFYLKKREIIG
jgi:membrane-bound metal-dependent hydrolase YbcI (DUF457 family)